MKKMYGLKVEQLEWSVVKEEKQVPAKREFGCQVLTQFRQLTPDLGKVL